MIRQMILILLAVALAACGTMPERRVRVETVEVKVPVKVPCIDAAPVAPVYQYGVGPYPGEAAALALLAADAEAAKSYARRWEAVSVGCIKGEYKLVE